MDITNTEFQIFYNMVKSLLYLFILSFISCSSGHNNQYGIYVPNRPKYALKDKVIDEIPE